MTEKIIEVMSDVLKVKADANTSQESCGEWDSLHHLNAIVALEEAFDVSFEPEEIAIMKDIVTIERLIKEKLQVT